MEKYHKKPVSSRDELSDMYARTDEQIGRDGCYPFVMPALVIASAAIVVAISLGAVLVWWGL